MQRDCVVCGRSADVYCHNDLAYLCFACDHTVHSAHELAKNHKRTPISEMDINFIETKIEEEFNVVNEDAAQLIHMEHHFSASDDDRDFLDPWCSVPSTLNGASEPSGPGSQDHVKSTSIVGSKLSSKTGEFINPGFGSIDPAWDDDDILRCDVRHPFLANECSRALPGYSLFCNVQLFDFDLEEGDPIFAERAGGQNVALGLNSAFPLDPGTDCLVVPDSEGNAAESPRGKSFTSCTASPEELRDETSNGSRVSTCAVYQSPEVQRTIALPAPAPLHQVSCPTSDQVVGDWFSSYVPHCLRPIDPDVRVNQLQRRLRVQRFREKKKNRRFKKLIRYASRKRYAEVRPRIKGRFARKDEILAAQATGVPLC